ncbi:hypothetical protein BVU17_00640 [Haloarcula taiwanensis]|uniref:Uncharacterized protein n=1 Tax=Haloarcula taiwanensis TaxID=1932004 RepID=A0A2H4ZUE5_9EURY|nr:MULTISPECIES: hypothetical protein [Haloarcula]AUG46103.1 hypothetical protein BVU17_00640 [Haloarcula taiwanensis]RLM40234.1 hypothetical protein DVK01_06725 [Haloarcula sp. Atlit-120R]
MELALLIDSALLVLGVGSLLAIPWVLAQSTEDAESEYKLERIVPLLIVIAYVLSKLVPGRFVTVTPAVDSAIGAVVLTLVALYLLLIR